MNEDFITRVNFGGGSIPGGYADLYLGPSVGGGCQNMVVAQPEHHDHSSPVARNVLAEIKRELREIERYLACVAHRLHLHRHGTQGQVDQ